MRNFALNLLLVLASLILTVFLIEGGLQLAAHLYTAKNTHNFTLAPAQVRILCLGESTTAMGGEHSYPKLLQKLLQEKNKNIVVINEGQGGSNSFEILEKMPRLLAQYQPHIVLLMMGINDSWALSTSAPFLDFKFFKLLRLLSINLRAKKPAPLSPFLTKALSLWEEGHKTQAEKEIDDFMKPGGEEAFNQVVFPLLERPQKGPRELLWHFLQRVYAQNGETELKVHSAGFMLGLATSPHSPLSYQEAQGLFSFLRQNNQASPQNFISMAWIALAYGETKKAGQIIEEGLGVHQELELLHLRDYIQDLPGNVTDPYSSEKTKQNYREVVALIQNSGAVAVPMQYPNRSAHSLRKLFPQLLVIDHDLSFKKAMIEHSFFALFEDSFAGDTGHFTPLGAHLVAQKIAQELINKGVIATTGLTDSD